jgi:hypothetical protein
MGTKSRYWDEIHPIITLTISHRGPGYLILIRYCIVLTRSAHHAAWLSKRRHGR